MLEYFQGFQVAGGAGAASGDDMAKDCDLVVVMLVADGVGPLASFLVGF